jgi:hypothetical protein
LLGVHIADAPKIHTLFAQIAGNALCLASGHVCRSNGGPYPFLAKEAVGSHPAIAPHLLRLSILEVGINYVDQFPRAVQGDNPYRRFLGKIDESRRGVEFSC